MMSKGSEMFLVDLNSRRPDLHYGSADIALDASHEGLPRGTCMDSGVEMSVDG